MAQRAEDITGDEEALLDLLVRALEAPVFVLDDAVALVALTVELTVDDAPVDVAEARDSRNLPAHPHRHDPALVETVAVDHQVLRLVVEDVRPELLEEPADVDHLEDEVARVEVQPDGPAPVLEDPPPHPRGRRDVVAARPLVVREQHRAVLERDLAAVVLGEPDDVGPD